MTIRTQRRFLVLVVAALVSLGSLAVYSATAIQASVSYGHGARLIINHLVAIGLGMVLGVACLAVPYEWLRRSGRLLVPISLAVLLVVAMFGPEIGGAHRWFRFAGLSVQPSEFAKLALVLYLADFLARKRGMVRHLREGFLPPLVVTGFMACLVLLQPDLGTALAMGAVALLMLTIARARGTHLLTTIVVCAIAVVVLIISVEYRRARLFAFLNPLADPLGAGFQILQSYIALASGGLFGTGLGASMQKLFYLPGAHTDFIFAVVGEELGLIGTTSILALFALFVTCGMRMALSVDDVFSKYLISGLVGLIGLQAIVHMGVVTGLLPTKGLPLPLVSYGGTAMVSNLVACGLILRASRHVHQGWQTVPVEVKRLARGRDV